MNCCAEVVGLDHIRDSVFRSSVFHPIYPGYKYLLKRLTSAARLFLITKAPREASQSELVGGGWPKLVGFFGYPPSGAGKNPVAKGACLGPDFGPFG